jgi:hypothetical protein
VKGRRIAFSEAELRFIESHSAMNRRELHAAFTKRFRRDDVVLDHIKQLCTRMGWTTGRKRWRPEDDALLRKLYSDAATQEVARLVGHTLTSTYQRARHLGLSKSDAYLASPAACRLRRGDNVGAAYRFKKGQVPPNKGKPMPFHPNSAATRFQKGQQPANTKWAGHERVSKDGYVEISVEETNPHTGFERRYVLKHKRLWEQANGPVPRGMALKCIDSNKLNTDPSNWELVPRALLPRLNGRSGRGYDTAPAELKPTIMAIAKLEHATKRLDRRRAQ